MKNRILLKNEDETKWFGEKIGSAITQKLLICLNGDLGAGKTCITKGIAKGLGIMDDITSPTFILVEEYEGRLPLYHFDVYRIDDTEELYFIGFDDYLSKNAVVIIEWSDKIESILPKDRLEIRLDYTEDGMREICLNSVGEAAQTLVETMAKN